MNTKTVLLIGGSGLVEAMMLIVLLSACVRMSESVTDERAGMNGGFEQVKNKLPVNWLVYTQNTVQQGDFNVVFDQIDPKEGKQALHFVVRSCTSLGGWRSPGMTQEFPVNVGEVYQVSFWIKNKDSDFLIDFTAVDAFHETQGPSLRSSETIREWKQCSYSYKIPEKMKNLRMEVSILKPGEFWIDAVVIEKLRPAGTEE